MDIIEPGHVYKLEFLDEYVFKKDNEISEAYEKSKLLTFVNREPDHQHPGTQTQEVLRALIDRTYHCENCLPSIFNPLIIHHLRMALVYHEGRALERKAIKGHYNPELITTGLDGHFWLNESDPLPSSAPRKKFDFKIKDYPCNYRKY